MEIRTDLETKENEYFVSTMTMSGKGWRWPEKMVEVWYKQNNV